MQIAVTLQCFLILKKRLNKIPSDFKRTSTLFGYEVLYISIKYLFLLIKAVNLTVHRSTGEHLIIQSMLRQLIDAKLLSIKVEVRVFNSEL